MIQQTALMLIAGLVFLFSFTAGRELSPQVHTVDLALAIPLLLVFTFIPGLLSYLFGRRAIKRITGDRARQIRQLQLSRRYALLFGVVVIAGFVFEVFYLKLPVLVDEVFAFISFENSRTLINMVPLAIAILLTRLAIFELDRQVRNTSWNRRRFLNLNLKLMLFPLLPFIVYSLIGDVIAHSPISVRIFFIDRPYIYWVIILAIIAVMYIKSPSFVRRIWQTHSLPAGEIRDRIDALAERESIKYRDTLVWNTAGGKIANAGMAGLLSGSRYIFLTDALLNEFTVDEIETVVAHEFGHIKHKHMPAYLVFSLGYLAFYVSLYVRALPIIESLSPNPIYIAFFSAILTLMVLYIYFIFIFRFLSRKFEKQADLYAIDSTGKPEVFKSALVRLAAVSYMPRRASRLIELVRTHPSVFRRLEFVDAAVQEYPDAVKYRRPVFHIGRVFALVLLVLSLLFITDRESFLPPGDVHYNKGREYALDGMIDEAILEFRESARLTPQSEQPHYALGILYSEKGVIEEAIREFEKALEINPNNVKVRKELERVRALAGVSDN